jgi:hypothetical protein
MLALVTKLELAEVLEVTLLFAVGLEEATL